MIFQSRAMIFFLVLRHNFDKYLLLKSLLWKDFIFISTLSFMDALMILKIKCCWHLFALSSASEESVIVEFCLKSEQTSFVPLFSKEIKSLCALYVG